MCIVHDLNHFWRVLCGLKVFDLGVGAQVVIRLQDGAKVGKFFLAIFTKNSIESYVHFVSQFWSGDHEE